MLSVALLIHFIVDLTVVVGYLFHATSHEQEYCLNVNIFAQFIFPLIQQKWLHKKLKCQTFQVNKLLYLTIAMAYILFWFLKNITLGNLIIPFKLQYGISISYSMSASETFKPEVRKKHRYSNSKKKLCSTIALCYPLRITHIHWSGAVNTKLEN